MFKGIPTRLWEVLRERGYGSIEEMARGESDRLRDKMKPLPAGTLYSWMTEKPQHRRRPWSPPSLHVISLITDTPVGTLMEEMIEDDARDRRNRRSN